MTSDSITPSSTGGNAQKEPVSVQGVGMTKFTDNDERPLLEMMATAGKKAIDDAEIDFAAIDSVYLGNMASAAFNKKVGLGNALAGFLGLSPQSAVEVGNTSASGASAFLEAMDGLIAGHSDVVLVVGGEKMSTADTARSTDIIGRITHDTEYAHGITLPSFGGLTARYYLDNRAADRRELARVPVKNHRNGARNPFAQFSSTLSVEDVIGSPPVAEPLRLFDCCPLTDGAAAIVLSRDLSGVRVTGSGSALGTHPVGDRTDPLRLESVERAGDRAFTNAGSTPDDLDVACIHDAFSILEWLELEALGIAPDGRGWELTDSGATGMDGELPVNPGGGLKARGHPLGATGVAQLVELTWQLRGDAPAAAGKEGLRTVGGASTGIALNIAGFGNQSVCTILECSS